MIRTLSFVLVLQLAISAVLAADKNESKDSAAIEATIQKGLKDFKDGKSQDAIAALQDAIGMIQKSTAKGLGNFFPQAPAGWEAGELETQSIAGAGNGKETINYTTMTRTYRKGEELSVTISLNTSPLLAEAQKSVMEAYKNPAAKAAMEQAGVKLFDKDGWSGWTKVEKDNDAEMTAFCKSLLLNIKVDKADEKVLQQFIGLMNLKALAESAPAVPAKTAK
jgi:hypothetical protein